MKGAFYIESLAADGWNVLEKLLEYCLISGFSSL